jgi:hypothetical protein
VIVTEPAVRPDDVALTTIEPGAPRPAAAEDPQRRHGDADRALEQKSLEAGAHDDHRNLLKVTATYAVTPKAKTWNRRQRFLLQSFVTRTRAWRQ